MTRNGFARFTTHKVEAANRNPRYATTSASLRDVVRSREDSARARRWSAHPRRIRRCAPAARRPRGPSCRSSTARCALTRPTYLITHARSQCAPACAPFRRPVGMRQRPGPYPDGSALSMCSARELRCCLPPTNGLPWQVALAARARARLRACDCERTREAGVGQSSRLIPTRSIPRTSQAISTRRTPRSLIQTPSMPRAKCVSSRVCVRARACVGLWCLPVRPHLCALAPGPGC